MTVRKGDWLSTYTGKQFYPLDPREEDVDINDIVHSLSQQARFNGHSVKFYSIAQHSTLVSMMCSQENALWGLLHDASEAYLSDIPSPIKKAPEFLFYREAEKKLMDVICEIYGLCKEEPEEVKIVDKKMLATEVRDLTMTEGRGWALGSEPYDFHIQPWSPEYARAKFVSRLHQLTLKKRA